MNETKSFVVLIIGIIVVGLAFYGVSYLKPEKQPDILTYNNFEFIQADGVWVTQWQRGEQLFQVPLRYNPFEVEEIPLTGTIDPLFEQQEIFISFDPTQEVLNLTALAAAELSINLHQVFGITPSAACMVNETEACADKPVLTCEGNESVILLKEAQDPAVTLDGTCITIQGDEWDIIRAADRLLYSLYNIIP